MSGLDLLCKVAQANKTMVIMHVELLSIILNCHKEESCISDCASFLLTWSACCEPIL